MFWQKSTSRFSDEIESETCIFAHLKVAKCVWNSIFGASLLRKMPKRAARDHVSSHRLPCIELRLGMFRIAVRHVSWCGVLDEACLMKLNDCNVLNVRLL